MFIRLNPDASCRWSRAAVLLPALVIAFTFAAGCTNRAVPTDSLASDEALIDEIQRRCFRFLWEQANPDTGLVADRARGHGRQRARMGSIASTGFALAAIPAAQQRGWVEPDAAYDRVLTTLRYLHDELPNKHGWYYHFVDVKTGERAWKSEVSSIDTALLMCGVLVVRQAYPGTEVEEVATKLYYRMDFPWMTGGGETLSMGWKPELVEQNGTGFLPQHWNEYAEHLVLSLMALGSPTHPLPTSHWDSWSRGEVYDYRGKRFFGSTSLFTHQYSHAFVDLRGLRDDYADYWHNSVVFTLAQREMCARQLKPFFPHYGEDLWGISSSDYERGYTGWGGPPATTNIDGTVVPYAVAGSIVFTPNESLAALHHMATEHAEQFWTNYGPAAAFNPHTGWTGKDVLGIDQGITFVMIENHRTGRIWDWFMANPEINEAMRIAGFRELEEHEADPARTTSLYRLDGMRPIPAEGLTDARLGPHHTEVRRLGVGWDAADWQDLRIDNALQWGQPTERHGLTARFAFLWDEDALHLRVRVDDRDIKNDEPADKLFRGDSVEVMLDPDGDGFAWKDTDDFRIGVAPTGQRHEWFAQRDGFGSQVVPYDGGYEARLRFPWGYLKVNPRPGKVLAGTVAVKSVDERDGLVRLNWCFRGKKPPIFLGDLQLR